METVTIQHATPSNIEAVRGLLQSVGLPHDDLTPAHLAHFLVARDGDSLCGVVGLEPRGDAALLRSLAVAKRCRNEGLGTRLTDAIERRARRENVCDLYLLTTTAADYFQGRGYDLIDRDALPPSIQQTEEASRLCPASATCMHTELDGPDQNDSPS